MFRAPASTASIIILLLLGVAPSVSAQDSSSDTQDVAPTPVQTSPLKDTGKDRTHQTLPTSESELLRLLSESNRNIDELERVAKEWSNVVNAIQQRLQYITPATGDINTLVDTIGKSATGPDIRATQLGLQKLNERFFAPVQRSTLSAYYAAGLDPGSITGQYFSKLDYEVGEIMRPYYQNAGSWHQAGGGGFLSYQPYGAAKEQPRFTQPTKEDMKELANMFTDAEQKSMIAKVSERINGALGEAKATRDAVDKDLNAEYTWREQISQAIDKTKKEINGLAIQLGLPLFCGTVLLLFAIPFIAMRSKRSKEDAGTNTQPRDFQFGTLVEISTVLLLTMSILILGLADKLTGPVLGTLLGGISGYVLNRVRDSKKSESTP